jgi:hypothetical protein
MTDAIREKAIEAAAKSLANRDGHDWQDMPPYREGYMAAARAAIAAYKAAMWQPMDSARRTGERILVSHGPAGEPATAYWSHNWRDWVSMGSPLPDDQDRRWRPLPLPPKEETKG